MGAGGQTADGLLHENASFYLPLCLLHNREGENVKGDGKFFVERGGPNRSTLMVDNALAIVDNVVSMKLGL